jgi:hypothetical protein
MLRRMKADDRKRKMPDLQARSQKAKAPQAGSQRVVRTPDLAKRANKVPRGRRVQQDRKARLGQQEVAERLSVSSMSAARHHHAR